MALNCSRILDFVFFFYFITHIPITIFIDMQGLFPSKYFPSWALDIGSYYIKTFKDPLFENPPVWFKSFLVCEIFLQFPFFVFASYGFLKGSIKCKWLRIPSIIYSSHVMTTVIPIIAQIMLGKFSSTSVGSNMVKTNQECIYLISIYSVYFFLPLLLLIRMLVNTDGFSIMPEKTYNRNTKNVINNNGNGIKKKKQKYY